jgi:hypothetical protein
MTYIHSHAPTLGSPTCIWVNCPGSVVCQGARAPTPPPPGAALAGPVSSLTTGLEGPYGFGNEFWRWRFPRVLSLPANEAGSGPERGVADARVAC